MRIATLAALLLGLVAAAAAQSNPTPAIINGRDAARGRFRYIASLRVATNTSKHFCGGTLIHPRVVLTAGHCVRDIDTGADSPPAWFKPVVDIGRYLRTTEPAGPGQQFQSFQVQQTVVHPRFATNTTQDLINYDAALMLLPARSSLPHIKLVGTARKPALPIPVGTQVTVIGWGSLTDPTVTPPGVTLPEKLQQLEQTLLNIQQCQSRIGVLKLSPTDILTFNFTTNAMICAAHDGPPVGDSCSGDSGGPLLVRGADASKDYQVGIVSWGPPKCNGPGVYTDMGMVFDWIADQVYRWTGDRLRPWTPPPFKPVTGAVLANNFGTGFDGKLITYAGAKGAPLDIISSVPAKGLGWYLNGILTDGSIQGTQALGYVAWSYGATLAAQAGPNGRLTVTLNNKAIRPGHPPNLGKLVTIRYPKDSCRRGSCADRLLEITVRPFIRVVITQPWIPGAYWGSWGSFAPYLQVKVTLLQKPGQQPTGVLGQTITV